MLQDQCKYERNQAYNLLDDLKAAYFYENETEIFHELRRIKSPLKGLIDLTREFMIRYDEKRRMKISWISMIWNILRWNF